MFSIYSNSHVNSLRNKKKNHRRMTKVNRIINKHNWKGKKVSSGNDDWKKFEKNNAKIALNSFKLKKRKHIPKNAYVPKNNSNHEK